MTTLRDEIIAILTKEAHVDPQKITPEATLKDLDITSLELIEIVFAIEEHFNVTLPDRDPAFTTDSLEQLVNALEKFVAGERSKLLSPSS